MWKSFTVHLLTVLLPVFGCVFISSSEILDTSFLPRYIYICLFLTISILWLLYNQWRGSEYFFPWKNPITAFMLLWVLAAVLSVIFSINRSEWLAETQKVFLYFSSFIVFLSFLNKADNSLPEYFLKTTVVVGISIAVVGLYQCYQYSAEFNELGMMKVVGLMSNKNLFSEYIALCFPFTIAAVINLNKVWKIAAGSSTLAIFTFIIILLARSVWVALIASLFVLTFTWHYKRKKQFRLNAIKYLTLSTIIAVAIAVVLLILDYSSDNIVTQRFLSILETDKGTASGRLQIWSKTLGIIKESLITGVGAGNWKLVFLNSGWYQNGVSYTTEPLNDYVGIFAETGILGFVGYLGILLTAAVLLIKRIFSDQNNFPGFYTAVLVSLFIYSVISFFNFPKDRIEHSVFLCFLLAFAGKDVHQKTNSKKIIVIPVLLVLFTGLVYTGWSGIHRYIAEKHTRLAIEAKNKQQWKTVIKEINKAENPYYTLDPTTTPVMWYRGVAYYSLGKTDLAFIDFQSAYKANPYHIHVLNNLATCFELKGNHEQAIMLYKEAIRINPSFVDALINITSVLYNLKQYDEALLILEQSPAKNNWRLVELKFLILQTKESINKGFTN